MSWLSLHDTATRWDIDIETLGSWAWSGRLPPHIARWDPIQRCWLLNSKTHPETAQETASRNRFWLPRIPIDQICDMSAAWADGIDPDGASNVRLDVMWWCIAGTLPPLEAGPLEFSDWCVEHSYDAHVTARRHMNVSAWYQMLTKQGVEHQFPHTGTRVTVVWDAESDWNDDERDDSSPDT